MTGQRAPVPVGTWIAVLGAVGLFMALFMPWYELSLPDEFLSEVNAAAPELGEFGPLLSQGLAELDPLRATAWQAFGSADIVLAGVALAVLGAAAVRLSGGSSGVWIARLGGFAAGLVLFKLVSPPGASPELSEQLLQPEPGLYLALVCALAIAGGGALTARTGG
jgi:hypothetical protein